ncbi:hypothetical protein ACH4YN_38870 [Streptomyces griseofuscus]
MNNDTPIPAPRHPDLWEDEIPSTDTNFLRIGPPTPIDHSHEEDE